MNQRRFIGYTKGILVSEPDAPEKQRTVFAGEDLISKIHTPGFSGSVHTNNIMPIAKSARKPNAALMKPVQPDDTLAKIVGSKPLSRSEVTKKMWNYIKKNKLQDAKKRTLINADDVLKAVFGGKKQVTMFEMTKHVSAHVK